MDRENCRLSQMPGLEIKLLPDDFKPNHAAFQVLDNLPVAVTVVDGEGRILYFNRHSTEVLDRKPEYLGRDIRLCHQELESIDKIDKMLDHFKNGNRQQVTYETTRQGKNLAVAFTPLVRDGTFIGCIQTVMIRT